MVKLIFSKLKRIESLFQVNKQISGRQTTPFTISLVDSEALEINRIMSDKNMDRIVYQSSAMRRLFNRKYHKLTIKVDHYGAEVFIDCTKVEGMKSNPNPTYTDLEGRVSILPETRNVYYSPKVDFQQLNLKCDSTSSVCNWPPKSLKKRKNSSSRKLKSKNKISSSPWPRLVEKVAVTSRSAVKPKKTKDPTDILKVLDEAVTQISVLKNAESSKSSCSCANQLLPKNMISKQQCTRIVQENLNQLSSLLQASYASLVDDSLTGR